jgi:uroporphyrinogen-III synthase
MAEQQIRIIALESRRAKEMEELLRRQGFDAFVAPSVREVGLAENPEALRFGEWLLAGEYEAVICLTGVGVVRLLEILDQRFDPAALRAALARTTVIARGPKPTKALRERGIQPACVVPDPATYHELLTIVAARPERKIAVQEYGQPDEPLLAGLKELHCDVTRVPVYHWALPEDTAPLSEAIRRIVAGECEAVVFTSSVQLHHLLAVAKSDGQFAQMKSALRRLKLISIGPTMSETLWAAGFEPAFEPSSPKLGILIHELGGFLKAPNAQVE